MFRALTVEVCFAVRQPDVHGLHGGQAVSRRVRVNETQPGAFIPSFRSRLCHGTFRTLYVPKTEIAATSLRA